MFDNNVSLMTSPLCLLNWKNHSINAIVFKFLFFAAVLRAYLDLNTLKNLFGCLWRDSEQGQYTKVRKGQLKRALPLCASKPRRFVGDSRQGAPRNFCTCHIHLQSLTERKKGFLVVFTYFMILCLACSSFICLFVWNQSSWISR